MINSNYSLNNSTQNKRRIIIGNLLITVIFHSASIYDVGLLIDLQEGNEIPVYSSHPNWLNNAIFTMSIRVRTHHDTLYYLCCFVVYIYSYITCSSYRTQNYKYAWGARKPVVEHNNEPCSSPWKILQSIGMNPEMPEMAKAYVKEDTQWEMSWCDWHFIIKIYNSEWKKNVFHLVIISQMPNVRW